MSDNTDAQKHKNVAPHINAAAVSHTQTLGGMD